MDRLTSIRAFVAVADHRRFRTAATRLNLSAAMISKHISSLEDHLGLRLLHRNSRNVSLTEDGLTYLARARTILDELDDLEDSLSSRPEDVQGTIRLTAPVWMANARFTMIVGAFMDAHPQCRFEIDLSGRRINLVEEGCDLALRIGAAMDADLVSRVIGKARFHLLATPEFLATLGPLSRPEDLDGVKLLAYPALAERPHLFFDDLPDNTSLAMNAIMRSENETLLRLAALQGLGTVFLPNWLADEDMATGALVPVLPGDPGFLTNINAVYPSRRLLPRRVRAFIDHLAEFDLGE